MESYLSWQTPQHAERLIATILCLILLTAPHPSSSLRFKDVSLQAGLERPRGRQKKYGGAAVADLDGDGYPDMILGHHDDGYVEIYINKRDGTFKKLDWRVWFDAHGINPFRFSPWHREMHFSISAGGGNGNNPKYPHMYKIAPDRRVREVTKAIGIGGLKVRGRSAIYVNLSPAKRYSPDVVFTNVGSWRRNVHNQKAFRGRAGPKLKPRRLKGFANNPNWYGCVTDIDNDHKMEILSFHNLNMHKVVASFRTRDITSEVFPAVRLDGTVAVAELDFDNDGLMDLYIARTNRGDLKWLPSIGYRDYLLKNVGGRYVDWSTRANIPRNSVSRGVTAGDFNNDGFVDLLVTRWDRPDIFLMNQGGRKFKARSAGFKRPRWIKGDMATAVDYNRDGRLDVIVSEGHTHDARYGGFYRIMKNMQAGRNFLLVRVGNSPRRSATSLHATVRVYSKGLNMVRRVGSPGTAVSVSYIELVHFGLGGLGKVSRVSVRWTDGASQSRWNVRARKLITFGRV